MRLLCEWKLPCHALRPPGGLLYRYAEKMLLLTGSLHKCTLCCAKQHYEFALINNLWLVILACLKELPVRA